MKMSDVKVGDRLVSTIAGGPAFSPITVTEITERGFRYRLDAPVRLHPLRGTIEGGEHFGHDGECFYEPAESAPVSSTEPEVQREHEWDNSVVDPQCKRCGARFHDLSAASNCRALPAPPGAKEGESTTKAGDRR